jgi:hypothetical protein
MVAIFKYIFSSRYIYTKTSNSGWRVVKITKGYEAISDLNAFEFEGGGALKEKKC